MCNEIFKTNPAVFAVGETYQIFVPVKCETLMWVEVGDRSFFDHNNGTLRSNTDIHKMTVPQKLLDQAKEYTICFRVVKERKPYFTETEDIKKVKYNFQPVVGSNAKAFLIADAHNSVIPTVGALNKFTEKYGEIDFLILAGDVPNDSGSTENFITIYEIADKALGGTKPIVYAKGNHDLRGICAEKIEEYSPTLNNNSYFTFRIGDIWGISLDCGEDKNDLNEEYGNTICCHEFRLEETEFIETVIKNAEKEYAAKGVKQKIIIVHNPFSEQLQPPFNIEEEIYRKWCQLLKENVKPDIMICGHFHRLAVNDPGCAADHLGQPCRVVIGSKPFRDEDNTKHFIGTGFFFDEKEIKFIFIDDFGNEYNV